MNSTFWVSSMPNHSSVSGMRAATGRFRPNRANGAPPASNSRQLAARMPSGTPTRTARPNPITTRCIDAAMPSRRFRSFNSDGKLFHTTAGLGSTVGETMRSSATDPEVTNHHIRSAMPSIARPASPLSGWGVAWRSSISDDSEARNVTSRRSTLPGRP